MTTAIEYALMAGASYITTRPYSQNKFPVPQGWTEFFHVPDAASTFQATAGFEAVTFKRATATGIEIVISFAGTYDNPLNPLINPDLQADIGLATGLGSEQLLQAAEYYLQVKAANPGATITLTGHSLGGGLAALIGVFFGVPATTFDQAPFAKTAEQGLFGSASYALDLQTYLLGRTYTDPAMVAARDTAVLDLSSYLQVQQNIGGIPNADLITNIRVDGEFLSSWFPFNQYSIIGSTPIDSQSAASRLFTHAPTTASGTDLHAQSLLTAFMQSEQAVANTPDAQKTLSKVTYKLTDLLGMIFDGNLYSYRTDDLNHVNLLEHLVRHQAGGVDGVAIGGDAMVTRFTSDLWKLAQDGGLTMNEGVWSAYSNYNNISKTLIAFAMQFYYEDTANANDQNKQLFTDLSAAGEGSNGIRFDLRDVSKDIAAAMDSTDSNVKVDLAAKLNNKYILKGYEYFLNYLDTTSSLSSAERTLIKSVLPTLRDWYIQAGASGMIATDTLDRGAFMLGGNGVDALVGGTAADLLVGNATNDSEWRIAA